MGDMTIGIALFVLIIVVGLAIGLRLSSTAPQRRAVVVAFGSMAVIAVLFYGFAMNSSQLWVAPVFAIACIVVPIGAYTLMMRGMQPDKVVSRRSANEAPKPIHGAHSERPASALDAAVMPMAPNHPVNEYLALQPDDIELAEDMDEALESAEIEAQDEPGDDAVEGEASSDAENATAGASGASAGESADEAGSPGTAAVESDDAAEEASSRAVDTEAFIEEYLVEQNEDEGGLFEPEASPSLQTQQPAAPVTSTSTMMVTIPFSEGDERFLVVSESTSVPNPILAYKRTTSSHLVPMGSAKHAPRDKTPLHADPAASVPAREEAAPAAPAEQPTFEQTALAWDEPRPKAVPTSASEAASAPSAPASAEAVPMEAMRPATVPTAAPAPQPIAASAAAAVAVQAAPATSAADDAAPEIAPAPAAPIEERTVEAPAKAAPASAPAEPAAAPAAPAPSAPVVVSEERFQEIMDKAQSLRERGMHPVAARLYAQAAETAPRGDAQRQARFEEIACYVKAGQNDKARALAAQLRTSNVLTRVERIKLDAIERMG